MMSLFKKLYEDVDSLHILGHLQDGRNFDNTEDKMRWYWKAKTTREVETGKGTDWKSSKEYFDSQEEALVDFLSKVKKFTLEPED